MSGFNRVKEIVDYAYDAGRFCYASFRKVPALATTLGVWFDLSMAPGNPKPNYYATAEMTSAVLDGNFGLFHFGNGRTTTDGFKFLHKLSLYSASATLAPAKFTLCDYLLYYPLIDMDDTNPQELTNSVTIPRYTDGYGVKAMLIATNPFVGGAQFQITYTNELGVSGQKSHWMTSCATTNIGTIVNSGIASNLQGPFINLQSGDQGIRSVQGIEFTVPNGGLATLVLVRPLVTVGNREITAVTETDFVYELPSMPKIYDGAYLNFICMPNGSAAAAVLQGEITTIWRN
jgi:hypothetical protein